MCQEGHMMGMQGSLTLSLCCRSVMTALASALEGAAGPVTDTVTDTGEGTGRVLCAAVL